MIISVDQLREFVDLKSWTDEKVEMKLKAIEQTIRSYTNNNFQNRCIRTSCPVMNQKLYCDRIPGLSVGDTVQITESSFNNGIYVVSQMDGKFIALENDLIDELHALVTKVEYPSDVVSCCIGLMEWEAKNRDKVGIKSETLSRHSVTYYDQDSNNQIMGYPVSLLGCLKAYKKVRF